MKEIVLTRGKVALVDDADFEKFGNMKWRSQQKSGGSFYAVRSAGKEPNRKTLYLHCEILGIKGVDHKNGNGLDCRRDNLRSATNQQNNQAFRRKIIGCSSKFRGVYWFKRDQNWRAQIETGGKHFNLGNFECEKIAARAYDKAAKEKGFFKEALNFPNG